MEISKDLLIVIAQIVPILLLASFLDSDVLKQLREYSSKAQYYWLSLIAFILIGLAFTLAAIADNGADGWRGWVVWITVFASLVNIFSIALWRVKGVSFLMLWGLDAEEKRPKK